MFYRWVCVVAMVGVVSAMCGDPSVYSYDRQDTEVVRGSIEQSGNIKLLIGETLLNIKQIDYSIDLESDGTAIISWTPVHIKCTNSCKGTERVAAIPLTIHFETSTPLNYRFNVLYVACRTISKNILITLGLITLLLFVGIVKACESLIRNRNLEND